MFLESLVQVDDYRQFVTGETIDRIHSKADALRGQRVVHMNSTYYAGGVVEILSSMTILMNRLGINTEWRLLRGTPAFFEVTREMHDALQNGDMDMTEEKKQVYKQVIFENAYRNNLDHDAVFMHDHHTMGMVEHYRKRGPWIWRCHLDLTAPHPDVIEFIKPMAEQFDATMCILEKYKQDFNVPQFAIMPAIDPLKPKHAEMTQDEILAKLDEYDIPTDRPIVTQISRFDQWKDPHGVVDAFDIARKAVDATLVMLGNKPSDDPEENELLDRLRDRADDRVMVILGTDGALVNALQRHATVVLQKSIREGFGLTVSEALWKGTPVIGGNAGGIPMQIDHGVNGYLVDTVEQAAQYIIDLASDPDKAAEMGSKGRERVREQFLLTRLLEDHLDLLGSFEPHFTPRQ